MKKRNNSIYQETLGTYDSLGKFQNFQIKQSVSFTKKIDFFEKRNNIIYQETLDIYDSLGEFPV